MGLFEDNNGTIGTGLGYVIGAAGADDKGGATVVVGTVEGISLSCLTAFDLSPFSFSIFSCFVIEGVASVEEGAEGGFSRSRVLVFCSVGKSSDFCGKFKKRGGNGKFVIVGWGPLVPLPKGNGNLGNIGWGIKPGAGGNVEKNGNGSVDGKLGSLEICGSGACGVFGRSSISCSGASLVIFV